MTLIDPIKNYHFENTMLTQYIFEDEDKNSI